MLNDGDRIGPVPGLRFVHRPRSEAARLLARGKAARLRGRRGRSGGGTALLYKDTILVDQQLIEGSEYKSFEFACYCTSIGSFRLNLINIYRPPRLSTRIFFQVFGEFLQEHLLGDVPVIITGDFNIHFDSNTYASRSFKKLLNSHSCTQHVDFPTHEGRRNLPGHTLDLVISRNSDNIIVGRPWAIPWPDPPPPTLSDHYPVMCLLRVPTGIL